MSTAVTLVTISYIFFENDRDKNTCAINLTAVDTGTVMTNYNRFLLKWQTIYNLLTMSMVFILAYSVCGFKKLSCLWFPMANFIGIHSAVWKISS